jgi:type IV pilus assembly protein PilA
MDVLMAMGEAQIILIIPDGGQKPMRFAQILRLKQRYVLLCAAGIASIVLVASAYPQAKKASSATADTPWSQELNEYPGLLPEFGKLIERLQQEIQYPPARSQSRLLPLLPETTMSYASISNYGNVTEQALHVFRQELQESAVLRDWWQHGGMAMAGPKIEESLGKIAQLQQYMGDEIVVSGSFEGSDPEMLMIAEVRKPGFKKFLQEMIAELGGESKQAVRILDLEDLASLKDEGKGQKLVVLVRPDYVVGAMDLATLRKFNARLASHSQKFPATPFGHRVLKEYEGGVTLLAAADLQKILDQAPGQMRQDASFHRSGFADAKYLVWEHRGAGAQAISQTELSFNAPRHGSAAWLANPRPLSGMDFVSPKAMVAGTVLLANPVQIFEDVKEMYSNSTSSPFASLPAFEQLLKLSVKDDLLGTLGGEVTLELDSVTAPKPVWKGILSVRDVGHLQRTLNTLLAAGHIEPEKFEEGGQTYTTVRIPSSTPPTEVSYTFVDGNLIIASSRETVVEAVGLHRAGESLGKSETFLASLLPGHTLEASALLYQNPTRMLGMQLRQMAPEMAETLTRLTSRVTPAVVGVYGEERAIREVSGRGAYDFGAVLVVAAVAIPNLLRSRMAANEASAVGNSRSVNVAQITYAATYPQRGFARDLTKLGSDPLGGNVASPEHASLLDASLANLNCTSEAWCTKSGYRYRVTTVCKQLPCKEYMVVAIPLDGNTGTRSFCSTSDGVIRYKKGESLTPPTVAAECKTWPPVQ